LRSGICLGGYDCYAISEIQAFGTTTNPVLEPAMMMLLRLDLTRIAN
jgi:hypothetical protein